jgi:hypothetical protein
VVQSIDRRDALRFQIVLPVLFRWADCGQHCDGGRCVNVGKGGMFILAEKYPPLGVALVLEFALPAFGLIPRPIPLRCVGQVSRIDIEMCEPLNGFAVTGRFVEEY